MYGVDKSISFQFLVGKELLQLCIGLYQLLLNFNENIVISTECVLRLINIDGSVTEIRSGVPSLSKHLTCLLGSTIENVVCEHDRELTLVFSNDYKLVILDSNEDEESFTITTPNQEVVV